mmetsp:Transcript_66332/g.176672  ORF Transcript_66332/g.176672 Transcript_66332/m.176672 type:complete len:830 (-) Transcript_66332:253-2742(-)
MQMLALTCVVLLSIYSSSADNSCSADDTVCDGEGTARSAEVLLMKKMRPLLQLPGAAEIVEADDEEVSGPDHASADEGDSVPHDKVLSFTQDSSSTGNGPLEGVQKPHWLTLHDKDPSKSNVGKKQDLGALVDGDVKTAASVNVYQLDLGEVYHISKIRINWRICKCMKKGALKIDSSTDGVTWITFESPQLDAWGGQHPREYITPTAGRYLRVTPTDLSEKPYVGIWEFEVYGYVDPNRPDVYGWYHSYKAGRSGLGGTEIMHLYPYGGKLFGGTGYWMNKGSPRHAEVVRLDCPFCPWVVEAQVNQWAIRVEALSSYTLTTDHKGNSIPGGPKTRLAATFYLNWAGEGRCYYVAKEANWASFVYWAKRPFKRNYFSTRAFAKYQDPITHIDHVFFVTGMDGIVRGVYNAASGGLLWFPGQTESGRVPTRPLALTVSDGMIYFSASSYIRRRVNGASPRWVKVFDMADVEPDTTVDEAVGGIRGLSSIVNPASSTGHSLFFVWAPNHRSAGCMVRLDPVPRTGKFVHKQEGCVRELTAKYLGKNIRGKNALVTYVIASYNFALPLAAKDGSHKYLIGYEILLYDYSTSEFPIDHTQQMHTSSGKRLAYYTGSGFLVRHGDGNFEVREPMGKRYNPQQTLPRFTAVRAFAVSPFEGDSAVFMGGYDCNHYRETNTAWVARGDMAAIWEKPVPCKKELGCGHVPGKPFKTYGCDLCGGREFDAMAMVKSKKADGSSTFYPCQGVMDYINGQSADKCAPAKASQSARICCKGCDFCQGTGLTFNPSATAGQTPGGHSYTCQAALHWLMGGHTNCLFASQAWKGKCCGAPAR